jgi:hypothetical protein
MTGAKVLRLKPASAPVGLEPAGCSTGTICADESSAPAVLAARVDWLTVSFRVRLDEGRLAELRRVAAVALREDATASYVMGRLYASGVPRTFRVPIPKSKGKWLLQSNLSRVEVLEHGPGADPHEGGVGWDVVVHQSGTELLAVGWRAAVHEAWAIAGCLGEVLEGRVGRLDLCADVARYGMRPGDRTRFVKRSRVASGDQWHEGVMVGRSKERTTTQGHRVLERLIEETGAWHVGRVVEDPLPVGAGRGEQVSLGAETPGPELLLEEDEGRAEVRFAGASFTGFTFGGRSSLSCRIYDKRLELRAKGWEKQEAERCEWKRNGWNGVDDVARVEFEFRGQALDELKLRLSTRPETGGAEAMASALGTSLDPAWAYVTRSWLRLVARFKTPTLPERVQPRWRAVQEATFVKAAAPRPRVRSRGGAKSAQTIGCALSQLASSGALPAAPWLVGPALDVDRLADDPAELVAEMLEAEPEVQKASGEDERAAALERAALGALERATGALMKEAGAQIAAHMIERRGTAALALTRLTCMWQASLARFPLARKQAQAGELAGDSEDALAKAFGFGPGIQRADAA